MSAIQTKGKVKMDKCPLCLNEQASREKRSDGFGEDTVAISTMPTVYHVNCPDCGKYGITDYAIWFIKGNDKVRQLAVTDIPRRLIGPAAKRGEILTITSEMLQGYFRSGDTVNA